MMASMVFCEHHPTDTQGSLSSESQGGGFAKHMARGPIHHRQDQDTLSIVADLSIPKAHDTCLLNPGPAQNSGHHHRWDPNSSPDSRRTGTLHTYFPQDLSLQNFQNH